MDIILSFLTASSQTDVRSALDTAGNVKRWNGSHCETIPLVFACIHVEWLLLSGICMHSRSMVALKSAIVAGFIALTYL